MKKQLLPIATLTIAMFAACQSDEQEAILSADDEMVNVSFGIDLGIEDHVMTRAEEAYEYLIVVTTEEPSGLYDQVNTGFEGHFTSLANASISLKKGETYHFHISAVNGFSPLYQLNNLYGENNQFHAITYERSVEYMSGEMFEGDKYYGSITQTISGNQTITVTGERSVYGLYVDIEAPEAGKVVVRDNKSTQAGTNNFYYEVSSSDEKKVDQKTYLMSAFGNSVNKTVIMELFDDSDNLVSSVQKSFTLERNHYKTIKVNKLNPNPTTSFDFQLSAAQLLGDDTLMDPEVTYSEADGNINDHDYVDLGLPSGLLWSTCFIGAESPTEDGLLFSWGGNEGCTESENHSFDWAHYEYCSGNTLYDINKYTVDDENYDGRWYNNSNAFIGDNLTTLEKWDDSAYQNWGEGWRMPTEAEVNELHANCSIVDIKNNNLDGSLVIGPNGHSIFLPKNSEFWTSTLIYYCTEDAVYAYSKSTGRDCRCYGKMVRPVADKK